jgi:hypothetical protein
MVGEEKRLVADAVLGTEEKKLVFWKGEGRGDVSFDGPCMQTDACGQSLHMGVGGRGRGEKGREKKRADRRNM